MSAKVLVSKKRGFRCLAKLRAVLLIAAFAAIILLGSDRIGDYFWEGLELAATKVLPATFPFMILSSFACAIIDPSLFPVAGRIIGRIFSVGEAGFAPMLIGNLSGFPIGSRMTAELYLDGKLSKDESERLIAYSANPSPPFVIAAVGAAGLGDARLGVILLISVYIGTAISARFFSKGSTISKKCVDKSKEKYDFVSSVKGAASSSLYMLAFVTLFYILISAVRDTVVIAPLRALLILPLEVTGAVLYLCSESGYSLIPTMGLCGFALGFGGLSVMAQVGAVTKEAGLKMRRYFAIKLAEGLFSALCAITLCSIHLLLC